MSTKISFLNGRVSPFFAFGQSVNGDVNFEGNNKSLNTLSFGLDYFYTERLSLGIGFSLHYNRDWKLSAYDISFQLIEFHI